MPPRNSGKSIAILVLGIVGLMSWCFYGLGAIPAIVALSLAPGANRELAASRGTLTGEGMIKAGVICAWIAVGLGALWFLFFVFVFAVAAIGSTSVVPTSAVASQSGAGLLALAGLLPQWRRLSASRGAAGAEEN